MNGRGFSLACAVLIVYSLFFTFAEGWNGQSRWALSQALARRGTTAVDEFIGESRDVCVYGGRLYAAKAPGLGLMGAPLVWLMDRVIPPRANSAFDTAKRYLVRVITVSGPAALLFLVLWRCGLPSASLAAVACCVGSPVLPYATLFYGHVPSAVLLFAAWRLSRNRRYLAAGMAAGVGIAVDYLTAVGVGALIVLAARRGPRRLAALVLGMIPAALGVIAYNIASFGTPFATGYEQLMDKEFTEAMSHGFRGVGFPSINALGAMLFGTYRGLFLLSPWLLLWPVAIFSVRTSREDMVMTVLVPVLYLVLLSGFPVWWGGASCTVRHVIIVLPLMAWAVAHLPDRWRLGIMVLGVLSTLVQLGFTLTEPEMPEDVGFPLADFVLPHLMSGRFRASVLGANGVGSWVAVFLFLALLAVVWRVAWRARGCRVVVRDAAAYFHPDGRLTMENRGGGTRE